MAATKANPIVFYDVLSKQGPWSPNTYKTRLTLNYKRLPYRVEYVPLVDVESKLKELGVPPSSHNPLFKYTLPMIADPSSEPGGKPTYVVESFQIALYLDDKYPAPQYPAVFAPGTRGLQSIATANVNLAIMQLAPITVPLVAGRSDLLDDRSLEYYNRTRAKILGDLPAMLGKADENWAAAKIHWDRISDAYKYNQGGPFIMGEQISFVDFVIGGIISVIRIVEDEEKMYWNKMAEWHDGRWARLWKEVSKLEADSSEVV